jgi:hypothetical protein
LLKNEWRKVDEGNEKMFQHKKLHYKGRLEQGEKGRWVWQMNMGGDIDPFCFCHISYHV